MGYKYKQFTLEDRCEIARLRGEGCSIRQIAAALDRQPSSVARELKRNGAAKDTYKPVFAQQKAGARRWTGSKLDRNEALREDVLGRLRQGWSPEQIAGRTRHDPDLPTISHETIYRFVYAQIDRHNDFSWRRYLPRAKYKRGRRPGKGGSPASHMAQRISVSERPEQAEDRTRPGHWEADLMAFSQYGQNILMLHDRHSRLLIAKRLPAKKAVIVARAMKRMLEPLPAPLRRTVTFDNGTEFARHYDLHALDLDTYFCDPHAPWQKGGVENAIGRMRRFLPRKTDLATLSDSRFNLLLALYNNTPRKCLDFRTPAELFSEKLLHFKCESTFRLSPE